MNCIYNDDALVGELTRLAFEHTSSRLLQIHRFSQSEERHVDRLLGIFDLPSGSRLADVGCGVGRLAELLQERRPDDLSFILINKSAEQLGMCPPEFSARLGVAENLPLEPGDVDGIMATYVLGHVDLDRFVAECARVLATGDNVYVYDLFKKGEGECRLLGDLRYIERTITDTIGTFYSGGFQILRCCCADFVPVDIAALMPNSDTLTNTVSAAIVFKKS